MIPAAKRHVWAMAVLFAVCGLPAVRARAADPNPPTIRSTRGAWPICRQWTPAEARHYAKWMERIYVMKTTGNVEQRTAKLERILTDPEMNLLLDPAFAGAGANPQLPVSIIRRAHSMVDCAKFTAIMPAYYAYRRGLPWMTAYVRARGGDVRTSAANTPVGGENSFTARSLDEFFRRAVMGFSSGNYRVELRGTNAGWSDTVPVALTRDHLMPGCLSYVDGHCLLLGKVSEYGELHFLNAGTSTTRDIVSYNGMNAVYGITPRGDAGPDEWTGCFQGLRVPRYPIAETDRSGKVIRVRRRTNEEMKPFGFSTEQYDFVRQMYTQQHIEAEGLQPASLHDLIRLRMKTVDSIAPLAFMEQYADEILDAYVAREVFVQDAWADVLEKGPIVYPEGRKDENIFEAHGRWETWSSPSSDVDRRNKYFYLADWMDYAIRWFGMKPAFIDLAGLEGYEIRCQADLAHVLIREKQRIFAARRMAYRNSRGKQVPLTLTEIEKRLYDLSFDPNHPPELRWGAPKGSAERASATSRPTPVPGGGLVPMEDAYRWQSYYRTVGMRETEMSCLRGMFTEGFPIRPKVDEQVAKWLRVDEPTEALRAWGADRPWNALFEGPDLVLPCMPLIPAQEGRPR